MKNFKRFFSLCLCLMMVLTCIPAAFAAEVKDATIDWNKKASLTIWKYDWSAAYKDGVWSEDSFISTGWRESYVEEVLGETVRDGDLNGAPDSTLGNGQNANGYALKGVEYTILRIADIIQYSESAGDGHPDYNLSQVLYVFDKDKSADFLAAIGLPDGAGRYENADSLNRPDRPLTTEGVYINCWFYQSNVLSTALANALQENSTTVKNALEAYIASNDDAITMDKTNENGKTIQRDLDLGLYLVVETSVPEQVTSTTDPFLISLPMSTVSGNSESASPEGGHEWNYDVVIYPKNNTGLVSLEKTVREAITDTGKNDGTDSITDGYSHNATGSAGDTMEYQIISTLPTITSDATALTTYHFYDSIAAGLSYNKTLRDVKIEFFTDKGCTDKVASWDMDSGKFDVSYSSDDRHMSIDINAAGLAEINAHTPNVNGKLFQGYSNYTLRITYTADVNSNASVIYGENGNCNEVVLTWARTSSDYYDTLIDDAHVYSFGLDLTKLFSDIDSETAAETEMFKHVKFKIYNATDGYWLTAIRNDAEGVYYATGHVLEEADATVFYPVTMGDQFGHIMIKGLEDDEYVLTEIETKSGYTLLKDDIHVVISVAEDADRPCNIYSKDVLGLLQNDPRYTEFVFEHSSLNDEDGGRSLSLTGIPQKYMEHCLLSAYAYVDGNDVTMLSDGESYNALAPLTVVNTPGFDLPATGDSGTWMYSVAGITLMAGAMLVLLFVIRKKDQEEPIQK